MAYLAQTDTLTTIPADTVAHMARPDTAVQPVPKTFQNYKELLHPAYIFRYDSLKNTFSLDSASAKAFGTARTLADITRPGGLWGDALPRMLNRQDGIFLSLLLCFILTSKILQRGYRFVLEGLRLLVTFREKVDAFNEITIKEFWGNLFLTFQPAFLIALLVYSYLQQGDTVPRTPLHQWLTIGSFTFGLIAVLYLKYLYYLLLGYTFQIGSFIRRHVRIYVVLLELFGVLIFVPTLVYLFSDSYRHEVLWLIAGLFAVTRIILFSRLIAFFLAKKVNFLFAIVYLCSVEIVPYILVIYGFVFLYKADFFCVLCH